MSHVVTIKAKMKDMVAVRKAFERIGGTVRQSESYVWWGRWERDSPLPQGFREQDLGKCHYAVSFPGCRYEVGLVEIDKLPLDHPARQVYGAGEIIPIFDYVDGKLRQAMTGGGAYDRYTESNRFLQAYAVEKAKLEAQKKRYTVKEEVKEDGTVKLIINTR